MNFELLKIELLVDKPIVVETLNRIGIINNDKKIVYPSCYLYSKNDINYLVHFKQMFLLSSNDNYDNISLNDIERRNAIAFCLKNWKLINVDDDLIIPHQVKLKVIPYCKKFEWTIRHKIDLKLFKEEFAEA